jgi:cytochrome c biogenesis protein CcmG, thiol:disulfide interchange protein DsbE
MYAGVNARLTREAALLAALAAAAPSCAHPVAPPSLPAPSASRLLGTAAPGFSRETVLGPRFDTAAAAGQVLLLDFFASSCPPCRRTLPALQALHQRQRQQASPLVIVGVSLDEDVGVAQALVARYALTFPVVHDRDNLLAGRFRVTEIPASFVIDRQGRVAWAGGGDQPDGALERAVLAVLAQRDAADGRSR